MQELEQHQYAVQSVHAHTELEAHTHYCGAQVWPNGFKGGVILESGWRLAGDCKPCAPLTEDWSFHTHKQKEGSFRTAAPLALCRHMYTV